MTTNMAFSSSYAAAQLSLVLSEVVPSYVISCSTLQPNTYTTFTTIISPLSRRTSYLTYVLVPTHLLPAIDNVAKLSQFPAEVVGTLQPHPNGTGMEWQLDVKSITFNMNWPPAECHGVFSVYLHQVDGSGTLPWGAASGVWVACSPDRPTELFW